jgi:MoaA/NifB/PqqE/SkfB family radical SAM enzyme
MSVRVWGENRQYNADTARHHLADELPLRAPYLIHVDPANICNFRCRFCPTGQPELLKQVGRPKGMMGLDLFAKIVGDIQAFPVKPKVLHLYKDGEPLVHPKLGAMASLAKAKGVADRVNITTNGALLTPERGRELLDAGIDLVRVSVEHVHEDGYRELTGTVGSYDKIVSNVVAFFAERERRRLRTRIWVKILNLNLSAAEIEKFEKDFAGKCDEYLIMTPMGWSRTDLYDFTLGTNPVTGDNGETPLKADRMVCPYPFYSLAVNFDGSVSVCCADWSHGTVVGDAKIQSLLDIWNGSEMRALRRLHLCGDRVSNHACGHCQTMQGLPVDSDLDNDRERLLDLFK